MRRALNRKFDRSLVLGLLLSILLVMFGCISEYNIFIIILLALSPMILLAVVAGALVIVGIVIGGKDAR